MLITPASLPTSPASPNRVLDLGIAVIVGLALGIGTALLRDRMDDHVRGVFDLEAQADVPAIGLIPSFRPGWRDPRGRLVTVTEPGSIVAEAYRGLRTRMLLAERRNTKAMLVTSPGWEDKSTVAANLAATIAQSGRSVVLVCADLRWGRAHKLFAPVDGYGLSGLLEGGTNLEDALQATEVPGLQLLPPGMTPADPAALLGRLAWRMGLGDMQVLADVVVIEAPPVLTGADIQPLATLAEMILMVTDAKRTTRAQVRLAVREIRRMRGNLTGCVLDNVRTRRRLWSRRPQPVAHGHAEADRLEVVRPGVAVTGVRTTPTPMPRTRSRRTTALTRNKAPTTIRTPRRARTPTRTTRTRTPSSSRIWQLTTALRRPTRPTRTVTVSWHRGSYVKDGMGYAMAVRVNHALTVGSGAP